jgi:hypothetical protein
MLVAENLPSQNGEPEILQNAHDPWDGPVSVVDFPVQWPDSSRAVNVEYTILRSKGTKLTLFFSVFPAFFLARFLLIT